MGTTIVFSGGPVPTPTERTCLVAHLTSTPVTRIVVADSGLHVADSLDVALVPGRDVVLGDMDSVDQRRLAEVESAGIAVERFPTDKDATDLELALADAATRTEAGGRIVVVGTTSGRFDHVLAVVSTLSARRLDCFERSGWLGTDVLHVVDGADVAPRSLDVGVGRTFSLLAVNGVARGVTLTGARWELHGETLEPGSSRGVSNESVDRVVTVGCAQGTVLVVVPGASSTEVTR